MKKPFQAVLFALIAISLLTISSIPGTKKESKKQKASVEGTWQLVSYKYGPAQSEFTDRPESLSRIKVINKTHFIWVDVDKSGKVLQSAGGKYTQDGDTYTEDLEFGLGMDNYLKTKPKYTLKITENMLFLTGFLADGYRIEEIWKRINQ